MSVATTTFGAEHAELLELSSAIIEQAAVGIARTDLTGRFLQANRRYCEIVGRPPAELQKLRMQDITHPVDLERNLPLFTNLVASGKKFVIEKRYIRPDGSLVWVNNTVSAIQDANGRPQFVLAVVHDITDRVSAEQARAKLVDEFERQARIVDTVLSSIPDFAYIFDREARFIFANKALLDLWGLELKDVVGKNFFELIYPPELATKLDRQVKQVFHTGQGLSDETLYVSPSGASGYFEYIFKPVLGDDGRVELVAGSTRDITERKELLESERAARTTAERASQVKDEFLATLSHELRTPLAAILGWVQLMRRRRMEGDDLNRGLETIERNARVQTQLIEELLDMSRIISGKLRLDTQQLQPILFIEEAVQTVMPAASAKGIQIVKILDPMAEAVWGDPNRLQQVVWNLLSNAIKFTPRGGTVRVFLQCVESHLQIKVEDTGLGISAEFLPHVFDRFRQADASTNRKHGGLGLGLAIVKQLVELHGGTVRAESDGEGKGTSFIVMLPVGAAQKPHDDGQFQTTSSPGRMPIEHAMANLSGLCVLVVDDEHDARELVKRVLEDCSAEVLIAESAAEALAAIRLRRPDVLVSDIGMPEVDGYEFLRRARALWPGENEMIRAVALTAFARSEDRTKALLAGYTAHLSKPMEPSELVATIASVAGRMGKNDGEHIGQNI